MTLINTRMSPTLQVSLPRRGRRKAFNSLINWISRCTSWIGIIDKWCHDFFEGSLSSPLRNHIMCSECGMKHKTKNHEKYAQLYHHTVLNDYDTSYGFFFIAWFICSLYIWVRARDNLLRDHLKLWRKSMRLFRLNKNLYS